MKLIDLDAKQDYLLDGKYKVGTLVKCKDCTKWQKNNKGDGFGVCKFWSDFLSADKDIEMNEVCYCCYAKLKEQEHEHID